MNKTLLKHFTFIDTPHPHTVHETDMTTESLAELVTDMQEILSLAKQELLSPRPEAISNLLKEAALY